VTALSIFYALVSLLAASPGEISLVLLLFAVAVVDDQNYDDDLPGPRLCRVASA
jgi:hypothetical protein